jgi:hypothetical protein
MIMRMDVIARAAAHGDWLETDVSCPVDPKITRTEMVKKSGKGVLHQD